MCAVIPPSTTRTWPVIIAAASSYSYFGHEEFRQYAHEVKTLESAIAVSSSHDEGGRDGVWLRVRILNSAVFSFNTTVLAIRLSLRDAAQVSWASRRITGSLRLPRPKRSRS